MLLAVVRDKKRGACSEIIDSVLQILWVTVLVGLQNTFIKHATIPKATPFFLETSHSH